jgi:two-component system cell cycle response regulator
MHDDSEKTQVRSLRSVIEDGDERHAFVVFLSGSSIGRMVRLPVGSCKMGRSRSSDLVLEEDGVSRLHAEIQLDDQGQAQVRDLNSTNGTFVNGRRLKGDTPEPVQDGDRINIGGAILLRFSFRDQLEESFQNELYQSAVKDGLTGAYNKRYLLDRLEQEFSYAERHQVPLSVVVLDLDHFKRVNDSFGHDSGDQVLETVSRTISQDLRPHDVFARYGGEEFVLLMRETTLADAMRLAERVRDLVEQIPFSFKDQAVTVTASIGVASTDGAWHTSGRRLFVTADRNLYRAKQSGRNAVVGPDRAKEGASDAPPEAPSSEG